MCGTLMKSDLNNFHQYKKKKNDWDLNQMFTLTHASFT